jgi:hypothetical protein
MAGPLGLTTIDLGTLPNIVTSPTYTDIFNETVGVLGTGADGMPARIAELADRAAAFEADVALGDGDLADTINAGAAQDVSTANNLAALVPTVSAAGDALLGSFASLVTGPPSPAGTGGSTTDCSKSAKTPTAKSASDFPSLPRTSVVYLNQMTLNCPAFLTRIYTPWVPPWGQHLRTITPISGDTSVFSYAIHLGNHNPAYNSDFSDAIDITVQAAKAGRYLALVRLTEDTGESELGIVVQIN